MPDALDYTDFIVLSIGGDSGADNRHTITVMLSRGSHGPRLRPPDSQHFIVIVIIFCNGSPYRKLLETRIALKPEAYSQIPIYILNLNKTIIFSLKFIYRTK